MTTMDVIPAGHCQCGCGLQTTVVNGQPRKFIHNHHCFGKNNAKWNGGRKKAGGHVGYDWYWSILTPDGTYVLEHVLIAEGVIGRRLPTGAVVHHIDHNGMHNVPSNFVICQNQSYHKFIHAREIALIECGHANWRKCKYCHQWDHPENLYFPPSGKYAMHRTCNALYHRNRREASRDSVRP